MSTKDNGLRAVAVIPAYNEEHNIARVILQTRRFVDGVIICDDGSTDMTSLIAEELGARVVKHTRNRGKGEALKTLYKEIMEIDPDFVITVDGDGQHDPEDIPMLLKPLEAGECDVVVGSRYIYGGKMDAPLYRRLGLRVVNFLYRKVAGVHVKDTQCGFRAFTKRAFEYLMGCDAKGYGVESEHLVMAARNGIRVMEVPISVRYNGLTGNSKKSPLVHGADLIWTLFRLVVEERPLLYLGLPGTVLAFIGAVLGMYLLWMSNATGHFSTPVAMLTLATLLGGLLLAVVAITSQELKRINERLTKSQCVKK